MPKPQKKHGWEGMAGGKPPFKGAAPPIHLHHEGKYHGKGRIPKQKKAKK